MVQYLFIAVLMYLNASESEQTVPFCELKGKVYIEESPGKADYIVYNEESEAFAEVLVYEEENELYADRPGIWYFVKKRTFADFTIYFTSKKANADFTVYFIDSDTFAGCQ